MFDGFPPSAIFPRSAICSALGDLFRLRRRCTCRWLVAWQPWATFDNPWQPLQPFATLFCTPKNNFRPPKPNWATLWGELGSRAWGNHLAHAGGTGSPVTGKPLGRDTLTHSLLETVRTPSGKPGWGTVHVLF